MIELHGAFEGGKAALGLVGEAIKIGQLLSKNRESDKTLANLLGQLRSRAGELARQVEQCLVQLRRDLEDANVDESRSIDELLRDTQWYQWPTRSRLREARNRFRAIEDRLRVLLDDVNALLLCSGQVYETDGAFADARHEKIALMNSVSTELPLKALFAQLSELATRLEKQAAF